MATLPRSKSTGSAKASQRPQSEFDSGLNASAAWTEHLERGSLSDEEPDSDDNPTTRPARALYEFKGKAEFRELSVEAGDGLEIIKEDLADGWSLVKNISGEIGLLPHTYYTFTSDFTSAPDLIIPQSRPRKRDPSTTSLTPRGSPTHESSLLSIIPQNTGEWLNAFPSFRQSLLGGKSLNRFSSFVASGAEEWILKGSVAEATVTPPSNYERSSSESSENGDEESSILSRLGLGAADDHFIDTGPSWKTKLPPFRVMVHSPSKRASTLTGAFTMYSVTSLFYSDDLSKSYSKSHTGDLADPSDHCSTPTRITVYRRFSHFIILHTSLTRRLPGIALPPLPEKQYAGRFSEDFVEARRGDLERYINRVVRHPVARYAEVVTFFLGCENDLEWKRLVPEYLATPPAGASFYGRVFHPAFNLDADDATEAVDRFEVHTRAVGQGVQGLRNVFGQIRDARIEMSKAERLLSYSLLSLITSKPLASAPMTGANETDKQHNVKGKGLLNEDGAWCWREGCEECLKLTKAMQKTSETFQSVADLYDDHARRTQLATHEALKGMAHPSSVYEAIMEIHRSALSRYKEVTLEGREDEYVATRCETVLNATMAEMETYHSQKGDDFHSMIVEHLEGEIVFYEQVLNRLKIARRSFEPPQFDELAKSPRKPSIYERELENPRLNPKPLLQPCPHVYDSAPMRPVSVAIQEGVGILLLGPSSRGSVFGKFW